MRLQSTTHEAEEEPMAEMSERDKFMLDLNGFLVVEVSAARRCAIVSPHSAELLHVHRTS